MTQRQSKKTSAITNFLDSSMFAIQGRILTPNGRGRRERRGEEQGNCRAMERAGTAVKAPAARAEEAGCATLLTRRHLGRPPAPQHRQPRAAPALSPRSSVPAVGRAGEPGSLSAAQLGPSRPPPASYSLPWARRAAAAEPWPGRSRAGLTAQPRRRPRRRWLPPGGGGEGGPGLGCFRGLSLPVPLLLLPISGKQMRTAPREPRFRRRELRAHGRAREIPCPVSLLSPPGQTWSKDVFFRRCSAKFSASTRFPLNVYCSPARVGVFCFCLVLFF